MKYHADWSYPTEVRFGVGRIGEIPEASKKLKISRPLLITDNIIQKLPFAQEIQENLESFARYNIFTITNEKVCIGLSVSTISCIGLICVRSWLLGFLSCGTKT